MKFNFYLSLLCVLCFLASACSLSNEHKKKFSSLPETEAGLYFDEEKTKDTIYRLGEPLASENHILMGNIFAVMIDNHRGARPYHQGLSDAPVIFEMPAEGGIPRLVAIFSDKQNLTKIGPVRSARKYFLDISEYFQPVVVHAGGSPEALEILDKSYNFLNLDNEFEEDEDFWRDYEDAPAPHNLFTSSERIQAFAKDENWSAPFNQEPFYYDPVFQGESTSKIEIDFGLTANLAIWNWDDERQLFVRWQDEEVEDIAVDNVVVIISEQWLLEDDDKFRIGVDTTSGGKAFIFRDGQYSEVKWERSKGGRFQFFDEQSKPVGLVQGKTFVEFLGSAEQVEITE